MEVLKCDRCGKIYAQNKAHKTFESIANGIVTGVAVVSFDYTDKDYDLCDDCIADFYDFIDNKDVKAGDCE